MSPTTRRGGWLQSRKNMFHGIILPFLFSLSGKKRFVKEVITMIFFGVDRAAELPELFRGRVALLTGPSGRTTDNRSTTWQLRGLEAIKK